LLARSVGPNLHTDVTPETREAESSGIY